ncbi:uncharacterized protein BP5553_07133 [Venustampulla echinocandica]|uniref:Uncharacterized protein n=1 Tax=Venustampulla echinocandica TaxID=2656787 RepID=A0A370TIL9_9HELO|nr:uncharacterized protein BP5553_07133 [Venustampulla echinocandica]RDL35202.1 hypothetical protein BP5553_07133 [Venustampulla echinocandica]
MANGVMTDTELTEGLQNSTAGYNLEEDILGPIAVVGLSLKFPQDAACATSFWEMLMEGRSSMTTIPKERFDIESFHIPGTKRQDALPLRGANFVKEDIGAFDAGFFNISPAEASAMDPMQRILLETAYRAFENAGIPLEKVTGSSTSVYTGCFSTDYLLQFMKDPESLPTYAATGVGASLLANRLSWFFDLKGPSVNLDSACSSSGMALDMACAGLRDRSCNMSLVGGCNLTYAPDYFNILTNLNMLSHDGRSFAFDSRANGYARGEGFGVVILKRLEDAIADGDTIRGVIRSTGCNQDGRTPGITQPSSVAQEALIRETYRKAGLSMTMTRFCEAHGTGTALGDPIEAMAVGCAFKDSRTSKDPLIVGALKSNIGHLEGASGIAGLIKTIMVLEKGIIPPNAGFENLNRKIDPLYLCLKFPTTAIPWPTNGLRRASINSFGFGGSNSHVVIDDAYNFLKIRNLPGKHRTVQIPPEARTLTNLSVSTDVEEQPDITPKPLAVNGISCPPKLYVFSADSETSVGQLVTCYADHFKSAAWKEPYPQDFLDDLAYTLGSRRTHLPWRSYCVARSTTELQGIDQNVSPPSRRRESPPRIGFLFTGQGSQWYAMGRELLIYPIFQNSIREADVFLRGLGCSFSVLDEFTQPSSKTNIDIPVFSQTLCTVLQVALVELLESFGITPSAVAGHSSGEIAAAYATGALSKESAWKVAYYRGLLATTLHERCSYTGAMLAVALSAKEVAPYFAQVHLRPGEWSPIVSCYNSPSSITVSGTEEQIDELISLLDGASVFNRKLRVPVAYHSPQMMEIAAEYLTLLETLTRADGSTRPIGMISSVTSDQVSAHILSQPKYWVENMVCPVQFSRAVENMCSRTPKSLTRKLDRSHRSAVAVDYLLEVGPHGTLKGPIRDILRATPRQDEVSYDSLLSRNVSALDTVLNAVGRLHCAGYSVDLLAVNEFSAGSSKAAGTALVDLPEYPFNHSQTYWYESRISRDFKHKKHGHVDLLGKQSLDWNPLAPRWRHFLRTKDMPWVEDHKINGVILYPASGMLVMAIEAARQINDDQGDIVGYQLDNVIFSAALDISTNQGELETQISLNPQKNVSGSNGHLFEFVICSYAGREWTENCRGMIHVYFNEGYHVEDDRVSKNGILRSATPKSVDENSFYRFLDDCGYGYGPSFQRILNLQHNDHGEAVAEVSLYGDSHPATGIEQAHVIHPTTLDAIMHLEFAALTKGCKKKIGTFIPTKVDSMWISAVGLGNPATKEPVTVFTRLTLESYRHSEASFVVLSPDGQRVLLKLDGVETTAVATAADISPSIRAADQVLCYLDTKIDIGMVSGKEIIDYLSREYPQPCAPIARRVKLQNIILHSLLDAKRFLGNTTSEILPPHIKSYIEWMDFHLKQSSIQYDSEYSREIERERSAEEHLYCEVGKQLPKVLSGEISSSQLLFESDLVKNYYSEKAQTEVYFKRLLKYVDLMAHKNPGMKVLEIGGGTGTFTEYILYTLQHHLDGDAGVLRCRNYDFTDIGSSFIQQAKERFAEYSDKVRFSVLDVETDVVSQGYEAESYDLIVAISVIHATQTLEKTLHNVRKLLKPGGTLLLQEPITPMNLMPGFVFGILPGWWLGTEENRKLSPLVDEDTWNALLLKTGFTGTEIVIRDCESESCREMSFMISKAASEKISCSDALPCQRLRIIVQKGSLFQQAVAERLQIHMKSEANYVCDIITLQTAATLADMSEHLCVFVPEVEGPFLMHMDEEDYGLLKAVLYNTSYILWLTRGGGRDPQNPAYAIIDGFARSFRVEVSNIKLVVLALQGGGPLTTRQVESIFEVMTETLRIPGNEHYEREYIERDSMLHINRVVEANDLKGDFIDRISQHKSIQTLAEAPPVLLNITVPGQLDTLHFIEDDDAKLPLGADEVEIEVKAIGLSFHDYTVTSGRSKSANIGTECAGVVRRANTGLDLHSGDRVWMQGTGTCRTLARSSANLVSRLPPDMSFEQACALPLGSVTASYALHQAARIQKGDSVLIHSTGMIQEAALQLAREVGIDLYVVTRYGAEKDIFADLYQIPKDRIISETRFSDEIKRLTKGRGVDIVLNSLPDAINECFECISPFGVFVDIVDHREQPTVMIRNHHGASNVTFITINSAVVKQERPHLMHAAIERVLALASAGQLKASNVETYPLSKAQEAFEQLKSMGDSAKVVLSVDTNDKVKMVKAQKDTYRFSASATYVIAGGLRGIGQSVTNWMARKGVKYLILLSRFGPTTEEARKCVSDLLDLGIHVETPQCDITNLLVLKQVLLKCQETMPPVRGCIHLANNGEDMLFENMPHSNWSAFMGAKARGAWNLHSLLPSGLDFFVMTSSIAGVIGGISHVAYSAANTYLDGLARYRLSLGERAVSICFGPLEDHGMLAHDRAQFHRFLMGGKYIPLPEHEALAMFDSACDPSLRLSRRECQPIIGSQTPGGILAKGFELPDSMRQPLWLHMYQVQSVVTETTLPSERNQDIAAELDSADTIEKIRDIVMEALVKRVAKTLLIDEARLDLNQPMHTYGVDSLTAVDLRNWFSKTLGVAVAVFEILGGVSFTEIGLIVARKYMDIPKKASKHM